MAINLIIPSYLKKYTGKIENLKLDPGTVFFILKQIENKYPDLSDKILENGNLKPLYMLLELNTKNNSYSFKKSKRITDFNTIIKDGQNLRLIAIVAGG
jgi:molybdopterin converting factor small subunit